MPERSQDDPFSLDLDLGTEPTPPHGSEPPATMVPQVSTAGEDSANLVDAHEPLEEEESGDPLNRDPFLDFYNRQARAPTKATPSQGPSKAAVIGGGIVAVLLLGGGATLALGAFDDDTPAEKVTEASETGDPAPLPDASERSDAALAAMKKDTPQGYQQALAIAEAQGGRPKPRCCSICGTDPMPFA